MALLGQYDCVLDGSDRLRTRYLVNDACVLLRRPLVSAAIHRFEGQAMSYVPDQGPCYRCLFPRADASVAPSCAEAGVLGVLPGVLGALQATEAIKLILGLGEPLIGRLLTFDALAMQWREFRFTRRPDCAVCGAQPTIRTLADGDAAFGGGAAGRFERLKPRQLQALMECAAGERTPLAIVDVREPVEFAAGHLPGAVNIPVNELPHRHAELPRQVPIVFVCRSGVRSQRACELAAAAGLGSPGGPGGPGGVSGLADLEGGLLSWAADIDPAMPVAPRP
jgi:adenylyltransferase/sulfurtransferase